MKKLFLFLIFCLCAVGSSAVEVIFDSTVDKGIYDINGDGGAESITKDGVTISCTKGRWAVEQYRVFKGASFTVSCTSSKITKVVLECTANDNTIYGPGCFDPIVGYTYEGNIGTWVGEAHEITLIASTGQVRMTKVSVTLNGEVVLSTPIFNPKGGTYYCPQTVTISGPDGAIIYYTTDGNEPTTSSTVYSEPINVVTTTTIKTIADNGTQTSPVASATYTIEQDPYDFMVDSLYYKYNEDGTSVTLTSGGYCTGDINIPSTVTYNGITSLVTSIGKYAFYGCSGLTSVTIPNSVILIGDYAFYGCCGLTSVTIGNSVTKIGDYAFWNCSGLTSVNIPNSVTEIGDYAFYGCCGLTEVTIGNSVTEIGINTFNDCLNLTTVNWNATNCADFFSESPFIGLANIKTFNFGPGVTRIPAFLCYNLKSLASVTIPNSVTEIGRYAFYKCKGLTSIIIPNSVTEIDCYAFSSCHGLTSVTIPNSVTLIGDFAFSPCHGLTSVTIGNSVTTIGNNAFYGCTGLTSVTIPNSVTSIGDGAFYECTSLTSVTIPNSVTAIGSRVFSYCTGLTSVTIPNSVTKIGDLAFSECSGLTSVTIPNSVTEIGSSAFDGTAWYNNQSDGLVYAGLVAYKYKGEMPEGTSITLNADTKGIANNCFRACRGLTSVTIGNSVTKIGDYAFWNCSGLTSVNIPNSVTKIGGGAFSECSGLTSVTIPNSVTKIGDLAFSECSGLKTVNWNAKSCTISNDYNYRPFVYSTNINSFVFGDEVEYIPADICYDLTSLTSVTIGKSVNSIGRYAFANCRSLFSIETKIQAPQDVSYASNIFNNVHKTSCYVYVPFGTRSLYVSTYPWNEFNLYRIIEVNYNNGDVNGDGNITASDITALYNYILYGDETSIATSDVNGDGFITSSDITAIYNIILGD